MHYRIWEHSQCSLQQTVLLILYLPGSQKMRSRRKMCCDDILHLVQPFANAYVLKSEIDYYEGEVIH